MDTVSIMKQTEQGEDPEVIKQVITNSEKASARQKTQYNKHHEDVMFKVGDYAIYT